jgi:hypothetical protein
VREAILAESFAENPDNTLITDSRISDEKDDTIDSERYDTFKSAIEGEEDSGRDRSSGSFSFMKYAAEFKLSADGRRTSLRILKSIEGPLKEKRLTQI